MVWGSLAEFTSLPGQQVNEQITGHVEGCKPRAETKSDYHRERMQAKSVKGKGAPGDGWRPGAGFQCPLWWTNGDALTPPAKSCDDTCKVLSTKDAHRRLGAQDFHWGLVK